MSIDWEMELFEADRLLYDAYRSYRSLNKLPYNNNSWLLFADFLDIPEKQISMLVVQRVRFGEESLLIKLKWLTGPNAKVMYKIWQARNETTSKGG